MPAPFTPNSQWIYTYAYEPRQIWEPWETEAFPPKWIAQEANKVVEQTNAIPHALAFILLTDTHITENGTWNHTAEAISQICKQTKINAVIHLGDFTDGMLSKQKTSEYANKILNDLKQNDIPIYAALGNHDFNYFNKNQDILTSQEASELHLNRSEANYSVDFPEQNLRFIFLNSYDNSDRLRYGLSKETLGFLSKELEKGKAIIFSHLPPMAVLQAWVKEIRGENEIMEIMNRHSENIIAFINGHNHCDLLYNGKFPIISINCTKCEYFLEHKPENAQTPFRKLGEPIQESFDILLYPSLNFTRFGAGQNRQIENGVAYWR